ncbi:MAG TPA: hypothetical protein VMW80_01150, partial [Candidatus Dormibacteraeota bacterium]|nr:hypothetical protein [Candidatus Dormibacteraeota bacterium]
LGQSLSYEALRKAAQDSQDAVALITGRFGNRGYLTESQEIGRTTGWSTSAPGTRSARSQLQALENDFAEAKKSGDPLRLDEASQRLTLARLTAARERI